MEQQFIKLHFTAVVFFLLLCTGVNASTISKANYLDKTKACIIGQMIGLTSGYEFEKNVDGSPSYNHPDVWWDWCRGTLGGSTYDQYNYDRNPTDGNLLCDDDIHIDLFNQHIINTCGGFNISEQNFRDEWKAHSVKDWGSGGSAMQNMNDFNYMPPFTGTRLGGNNVSDVLTEGWIEQETMGCIFAGMPTSAKLFGRMAGSLSSSGEALELAELWPAVYAIAYFETDARTALSKGIAILHPDSWIKAVYNEAVNIYNADPNTNSWRTGMTTLYNWNGCGGHLYFGWDNNAQEKLDRNMGFTFLSILYGANDYTTSVKIASLAGLDGDCTAATVAGLMGIIKGMAGTPQTAKDRMYANNGGIGYTNVPTWGASIGTNYPTNQKIDDLATLYKTNFETMLVNLSGTVGATDYTVSQQTASNSGVSISNPGFEDGNLNGWTTYKGNPSDNIFAEEQYDGNGYTNANTGRFKGTIITATDTNDASIWRTVSGLTPGACYKVTAAVYTAAGREARLCADNFNGSTAIYASKKENVNNWNILTLYVTLGASNTSMNIRLYAPATTNTLKWCSFDDIRIEKVTNSSYTRYEAENAVINHAVNHGTYVGGIDYSDSYVQFTVSVPTAGRYIARINYANGGTALATHDLYVNGSLICAVPMFRTGDWGVFSQNRSEVPLRLNAGSNTIKLAKGTNNGEIDYLDINTSSMQGVKANPTEVIEPKLVSEIKIYPNPASDFITIESNNPSNEILNVSIYDIAGRIVYHKTNVKNGKLTVNTNGFPKGIYTVNVLGKDSNTLKKTIIVE